MNTRLPVNARGGEQSVTAVPSDDLRRARRALIIVGLVLPAVITVIAAILIARWVPDLPDPAALHWGVDGVDGFGPPAVYLWLTLGLGLGLPALMIFSVLGMAREQWGGAARLLGAVALGLSGFSAIVNGGSVALQRGLDDATQAGPILPVVIAGFCTLMVLTAAGWVLQPDVHPAPAAPLKPAHVAAIAAGERVTWLATARMHRGAVLGISATMVILVAVTAVMVVQAAEALWIPLLTFAIIGLAFASSASFRVRAGADGLTVRSQLGVPRVHVPLDDIVSVRAVQCHPFGEFGGFGRRVGMDGRTGIVLRTGPAIEIERRGRHPLVVTVDGAEVGAATLQAYLDRRAAGAHDQRDGVSDE